MVRSWLILVGVACLLPAAVFAAKEQQLCKLPPKWKVNDLDPMDEIRKSGNVTVVALLKANCAYCLLQARLLQRLKNQLKRKGIIGISYLIVNMKEAAHDRYRLTKEVDFEVYQDKDGGILEALGGSKDDFFVYDKCGRLSYYLESSITYLGWPHVSNAILFTHQNKHGCKGPCDTEKKTVSTKAKNKESASGSS